MPMVLTTLGFRQRGDFRRCGWWHAADARRSLEMSAPACSWPSKKCVTLWVWLSFLFNKMQGKLRSMVCHLISVKDGICVAPTALEKTAGYAPDSFSIRRGTDGLFSGSCGDVYSIDSFE
jgi:hypothetical protein